MTLEAGTGCVHTAPGTRPGRLRDGHEVRPGYLQPRRQTGQVHSETWNFSPASSSSTPTRASSKSCEKRAPCWLRGNQPLLSPLLALQETDHLPRHRTVVHLHGEERSLRDKALGEIEQRELDSEVGTDRIYGMIENRPDWCISRQRHWGVPITAFYCKACGEAWPTDAVMDHVAELFRKDGSDIWYEREAKDLLPEGANCPSCGSSRLRKGDGHPRRLVRFRRLPCRGPGEPPELGSPADMYLEGSDQHRGWFHSSLLESVGTRGTGPLPDCAHPRLRGGRSGRKMSKSVGNVVAPEEIIKKFGAEMLRLWVAAQDYRDDIRISQEILNRLVRVLPADPQYLPLYPRQPQRFRPDARLRPPREDAGDRPLGSAPAGNIEGKGIAGLRKLRVPHPLSCGQIHSAPWK